MSKNIFISSRENVKVDFLEGFRGTWARKKHRDGNTIMYMPVIPFVIQLCNVLCNHEQICGAL